MARQQRIALIIGNGAYTGSRPLDNPVNDAALITRRFLDLGYEVVGGATSSHHKTDRTEGANLSSVQMVALIGQFLSKVQPGAVAVIYYAGHGLQVGGKNYLVPVDDTLDRSLPSLGLIEIKPRIETLAARVGSEGVAVVLLDACRDDPMSKEQRLILLELLDDDRKVEHGQEREATATRSRGGLSTFKIPPSEQAGRTFIGFATAPGDYAYDGKKGSVNSPFARALGHHLSVRGLEIEQLYDRVALDVREIVADEVGKVQDPWSETNLSRPLFLYPRSVVPIFALFGGGLIAGLIICFAIFKGGRITSSVPILGWGLGLLFGVVVAAGSYFWGSGKKARDIFLALVGPGIGFALALATMQIVPALQVKVPSVPLNEDRALAQSIYVGVTLLGGALYLIGTWLVRSEKREPPPRTPLAWLNRILTWGLPFVIVGVLLKLQEYMSAASSVQTAIAMFAVLGGVIYAGSVALSLRAQGGLFSQFGPFTGAMTVGLLMAALFAIYQSLLAQFGVSQDHPTAHLLLMALGTLWHGLLGAQVGYCLAYYVPDHRSRLR